MPNRFGVFNYSDSDSDDEGATGDDTGGATGGATGGPTGGPTGGDTGGAGAAVPAGGDTGGAGGDTGEEKVGEWEFVTDKKRSQAKILPAPSPIIRVPTISDDVREKYNKFYKKIKGSCLTKMNYKKFKIQCNDEGIFIRNFYDEEPHLSFHPYNDRENKIHIKDETNSVELQITNDNEHPPKLKLEMKKSKKRKKHSILNDKQSALLNFGNYILNLYIAEAEREEAEAEARAAAEAEARAVAEAEARAARAEREEAEARAAARAEARAEERAAAEAEREEAEARAAAEQARIIEENLSWEKLAKEYENKYYLKYLKYKTKYLELKKNLK